MKWLQRLQNQKSELLMETALTEPPEASSVSFDSMPPVSERDWVMSRLNACLSLPQTMPDFHQKSPAFHRQYQEAIARLQERLQRLGAI